MGSSTRSPLGAGVARFVLVPLLLLLLAAAAQQPPPQEDTFRLRARVEIVNLDVTVTDARGHFVRDLKRENFRVFDDGVERPVTNFAPVEAPARMLILVEASPAVYLLQRELLAAAVKLIEGLAADDWVAIATYGEAPRLLLPLTQNKADAAGALGGLSFGLGMTQLKLHESLSTVLDWLAPIPGKKAVVLLSTGLETDVWGAREPLFAKLRASEGVIYAIGVGGKLRKYDGKKAGDTWPEAMSFQSADRALSEIAALSGGRAYFPFSVAELEGIYREVTATLRHQYSLGFAPAARDGRFRRIEVQIVDDRSRIRGQSASPDDARFAWRVRTRPGYLAPSP